MVVECLHELIAEVVDGLIHYRLMAVAVVVDYLIHDRWIVVSLLDEVLELVLPHQLVAQVEMIDAFVAELVELALPDEFFVEVEIVHEILQLHPPFLAH